MVKLVAAEDRDNIEKDIYKLRNCRNQKSFEKLAEMFLEKHRAKYPEFIHYFEDSWILTHPNWHFGASKSAPNTNNSLESFNRSLKRDVTFRTKLPVKQFLTCLFNWVKKWGDDYESGRKSFKREAHISKEKWNAAQGLAKMKKKIKFKECEGFILCKFPGQEKLDTSVKNRNDFMTFSEYNSVSTDFYIVRIPIEKEKFLEGSCDCVSFFQENVCKHLLAVALRLKHTKMPTSASLVKLGKKRGPGRPAQVKHALVRE